MAITVDTLIGDIQTDSLAHAAQAYGFVESARATAAGTPPVVGGKAVTYVTPTGFTTLSIAVPAGVAQTVSDSLEAYFNKYFPDISTQFNAWLAALRQRVESGVPHVLPNDVANAQAQALDHAAGVRASRVSRSSVAAKGYSLPPGVLVGAILDESDQRTERLVAGAINSANTAGDALIKSYQTVISAALSASDARVAALNAMSALIREQAAAITLDAESRASMVGVKIAAARAAMAYYQALVNLDSTNTALLRTNANFEVTRFSKEGGLFYQNEEEQVRAAIAAAVEAGRVAQGAYSSLNTIVSASTVGFA